MITLQIKARLQTIWNCVSLNWRPTMEKPSRKIYLKDESNFAFDNEGCEKSLDGSVCTNIRWLFSLPVYCWKAAFSGIHRANARWRIHYIRSTLFGSKPAVIPVQCIVSSRLHGLVMVRTGGLEPPRGYPRQILSLLRLPIPPRPHPVVTDQLKKSVELVYMLARWVQAQEYSILAYFLNLHS